MRKLMMLLTPLLFCGPVDASAQQSSDPSAPKWDVAVTGGLFEGRTETANLAPYGDRSYETGRIGVSAGRYWTRNFKTELELAASGEGSRYVQRFAEVSIAPGRIPYTAREFFQHQQASARAVWQFFDNQWVHPYVLAGVAMDLERQRTYVWEQYQYISDGRSPSERRLLVREGSEGPRTFRRTAAIAGVGTKIYVSPAAFATTGVLVTWRNPAKGVSFVAGFGFDF